MAENVRKSSGILILFAWLIVGVPLGWGVYNTLLGAMKLFQTPAVQTTAPPSTAK